MGFIANFSVSLTGVLVYDKQYLLYYDYKSSIYFFNFEASYSGVEAG